MLTIYKLKFLSIIDKIKLIDKNRSLSIFLIAPLAAQNSKSYILTCLHHETYKLGQHYRKVSKNIVKILEKYFKNFENYYKEFEELFHKILNIISLMFENHIKKFRNISRNTSDIFEKYHFGKY